MKYKIKKEISPQTNMKYKIKKDIWKQLSASKLTLLPVYCLLLADADKVICDARILIRTHGCEYAPGTNSLLLTAEYFIAQNRNLQIAGVYLMPSKYEDSKRWNTAQEEYYISSRTGCFPDGVHLFMINKTCYEVYPRQITHYIPKKVS